MKNHEVRDTTDRGGGRLRRRALFEIDSAARTGTGPLSYRELKDALGLTSTGHVDYIIKRLRSDGLLVESDDHRARQLTLTNAGRRVIDAPNYEMIEDGMIGKIDAIIERRLDLARVAIKQDIVALAMNTARGRTNAAESAGFDHPPEGSVAHADPEDTHTPRHT